MKELCRLPSDQFHGVGLLRGADMGIFTADKAGSRKKTEIVTLYGNSVRAAYVKIEKAAQRVAFFDGNEKFFDRYRRGL